MSQNKFNRRATALFLTIAVALVPSYAAFAVVDTAAGSTQTTCDAKSVCVDKTYGAISGKLRQVSAEYTRGE